jgi:hypothetical protein
LTSEPEGVDEARSAIVSLRLLGPSETADLEEHLEIGVAVRYRLQRQDVKSVRTTCWDSSAGSSNAQKTSFTQHVNILAALKTWLPAVSGRSCCDSQRRQVLTRPRCISATTLPEPDKTGLGDLTSTTWVLKDMIDRRLTTWLRSRIPSGRTVTPGAPVPTMNSWPQWRESSRASRASGRSWCDRILVRFRG